MPSASELLHILSLSDDATAVYSGENIIIEFANAAMLAFWGKDSDIIGLELEAGVPELKGQPFKAMLQAVLQTGITDEGIIPAETSAGGELATRFYAYKYRAVAGADGRPGYILHTASDVTERLKGEQALRDKDVHQAKLNREQQLNEELGSLNEELVATNEELIDTQSALATLNADLEERVRSRTADLAKSETALQGLNEELSAINEELRATNEELLESQSMLQQSLTDLSVSEHRVRSIVASAPFPIGVYTGREMLVEFANQSIMDVWGKGNEVTGKRYAEVLPELAGSGIYEQLDHVFTTGVPFHTRAQRVDLLVGGKL